jgi:hypothetical protein
MEISWSRKALSDDGLNVDIASWVVRGAPHFEKDVAARNRWFKLDGALALLLLDIKPSVRRKQAAADGTNGFLSGVGMGI